MTSAKLRLVSLFMSIGRPHFPQATIDDAHLAPLCYPPGAVRAGVRQRSTKTQATAIAGAGLPVTHDDTNEPISSTAIMQAAHVRMPLSPAAPPSPPHDQRRTSASGPRGRPE